MDLQLIILDGTLAARPAATTLPNGSLYATTDTNEIYKDKDQAWVLWLDGNGGGGAPGGSDKNPQYNNAGAFGGVANNATATNKFLRQVSSGTPSLEQVAAADMSGLAPSATTDTTNANNITSGILPDARIADDSITHAKLVNVSADKLVGRGNGAGAGARQEITLGTNLSMTGTTLNAASGTNNPGGSDKNIQYNDAGAFGGIANNATATAKFVKQVSSGTPTIEQVADADLLTSDVTTNNVSTTKHGFAPKGDGDTSKFLNANGAYSTPSGGAGATVTAPIAEAAVAFATYTHGAGDFTLGQTFWQLTAAEFAGMKFAYDGFAAKTVKWTVWDRGTQQANQVNAPGLYTITFAAPLTFASNHYFSLALYINDGTNWIAMAGQPYGWKLASTVRNENTVGPITWIDIAAYEAGDAMPTSQSGTNVCPIQLTPS
jgi:hypothetical protein